MNVGIVSRRLCKARYHSVFIHHRHPSIINFSSCVLQNTPKQIESELKFRTSTLPEVSRTYRAFQSTSYLDKEKRYTHTIKQKSSNSKIALTKKVRNDSSSQEGKKNNFRPLKFKSKDHRNSYYKAKSNYATSKQSIKEKTNISREHTSPSLPPPPLSLPKQFRIFASCLPGLEPVLFSELTELGFSPEIPTIPGIRQKKELVNCKDDKANSHHGGFEFEVKSLSQIYKCHLRLGSASHIFIRCPAPNTSHYSNKTEESHFESKRVNSTNSGDKEDLDGSLFHFKARKLPELRRKVSQMKCWRYMFKCEKKEGSKSRRTYHIPPLSIRVTSSKSKLNHTKAISERVQLGILDALGVVQEPTPNSEELAHNHISPHTDDEIKILVRIQKDQVQISLDTSSAPLHQRGYRLEPGVAPLREDIAFALLKTIGWPPNDGKKLKNEREEGEVDITSKTTLLDPFCGSGTIVIEAASMANRPTALPPGRFRPTPLRKTALGRESLWTKMLKDSLPEPAAIAHSKLLIAASDRDRGATQIAKSNAERAGVSHMIQFETCAVSSSQWLQDSSANKNCDKLSDVVVVSNPPFGKRLSPTPMSMLNESNKSNKLLPLYQKFGHQINNSSVTKVAMIAKDVNLARRMGLNGTFSSKFVTQHGGLKISALVNINYLQ